MHSSLIERKTIIFILFSKQSADTSGSLKKWDKKNGG